jgi:hypothetical protein
MGHDARTTNRPGSKSTMNANATEVAASLDATVEWLRDRGVADRLPLGPAAHVSPSSAAAAASELARRMKREIGEQWNAYDLGPFFVGLIDGILGNHLLGDGPIDLAWLRAEIDRGHDLAAYSVANPPTALPSHP